MEIKVGATVITSDNATLGHVAEVREGAFRVDAPRAFDYWLAENIVQEASEPEGEAPHRRERPRRLQDGPPERHQRVPVGRPARAGGG